MYHKILLPTDGSKYAEKAAEHAIWIASQSDAEI
ncbi:MAG: universal stress protein, partial [Methanobacterium sp.]